MSTGVGRQLIAIGAVLGTFAVPGLAVAHLERPSYWPDPAPDTSVSPPAGGEVPKVRSLKSAVSGNGPGEVRVVCKGDEGKRSLELMRKAAAQSPERGLPAAAEPAEEGALGEAGAQASRPQPSARRAVRLPRDPAGRLRLSNNDRVVIMPGRYTEPTSRKQPLNDPKCAGLTQPDNERRRDPQLPLPGHLSERPEPRLRAGARGARRAAARAAAREPPGHSRRGSRACAAISRSRAQDRRPHDVIIDGAKNYHSKKPEARPGAYAKDVVLRATAPTGS